MTVAPQADTRAIKYIRSPRRMIDAKLRNALMATWAKVSPNFDFEPPAGTSAKDAERMARLIYASRALKFEVKTFNQLGYGQGKFLLRRMQEDSGDGPAYRAVLIGRIATELFGSNWNHILMERVQQRFGIHHSSFPGPLPPSGTGAGIVHRSPLESLTPDQAHSLIEELLSRLARERGEEIETTRAGLRGTRTARKQSAPNAAGAGNADDEL